MSRKSVCSHCLEEIPHSAWICPACGGWVADVTRFSPQSHQERAAE